MLKSLRRQYWVAQEFSKRHLTLIIRTVLGVIALSLLVAFFIRYIPSPRSHHRIGLIGKYTSETIPLEIRRLVSSGLVTLDQAGNPQPALAKSWQILDDGRRYLFELDTSLRWHSGERVKPQDLSYNFSDVSVEYSDNQIIFVLKDPFAPFFHAVSRPVLKNGKLGVGAFALADSTVHSGILQSITLVADHQKLTYKFYPTENSALTAFKLGEIDQLNNLTYIPPELSQDPRIQIIPNPDSSKLAVLFFNNNDSLVGSKSTRQALAYAVEDKSFGHERAKSPIAKSSWAYNPLVKAYDFDSERARSLLAQDFPDPQKLSLELKTMLPYLSEAEAIAQNWRETLGIQVTVKVVTSLTKDYQVFLADFSPPSDPDQYTLWHSTQVSNFTHYTNLKVDQLLEDGRRTLDRNLRTTIYQDFQRFLLEDSPAVFLFYTTSHNLSRLGLFQ